eukprot:5033889-Amphidinium_carterae.2
MACYSAESGYHVAPRVGRGGRIGASVDAVAAPGGGARTGTARSRRRRKRKRQPGPGPEMAVCLWCVQTFMAWNTHVAVDGPPSEHRLGVADGEPHKVNTGHVRRSCVKCHTTSESMRFFLDVVDD